MKVIDRNNGPRRFDLPMAGYAENIYLVRRLVDHAACSWGLSEEVRQRGKLVLTELATNAARLYEGRELHVWVANVAGGVLETAVWDPDATTFPVVLPFTEYGESGRGLAIVAEVSELGWYRSASRGGKVVWARVGR